MSSGLRTILRMDPDVVFLGEIRDVEAAEVAMRAASSGKCVFSTLHTRDVASTITALRDLRVDCRSLAGNLTGIINQRIVRRLCPQCRRLVPISGDHRALLIKYQVPPPEQLFQPAGCVQCRGKGFRGRTGVFEVVVANDEIVNEISQNATEHHLRQRIRDSGTPDLMTDALGKVAEGVTSIDEMMRMRWV
jgi:type II secretory ATPase GspE/PulE/Tfp pilus assembly ATPase PilB-like protein